MQRQRSLSLSSPRSFVPDPEFFAQLPRKRFGSRPPTTGPPATARRSSSVVPPNVIYFYEKGQPYYSFTNFSPHPVLYEHKEYPTSEHLFQAMKFLPHRPALAEHIRTGSKHSRFALKEARRFAPEVPADWFHRNVGVMDMVLYLKFTQHKSLKKELVRTGDAMLIEVERPKNQFYLSQRSNQFYRILQDAGVNDDFWGNGADGNGQNQLGLALMRLRDRLNRQQ
ncbi:hypothetical protein FRB96_007789 [Tulasnella sp. 330]|nr:hypothetical protein FRB96_007789 [Tulasnella sp. 330]